MAEMTKREMIAKAMWERTHDGKWPEDAEADTTLPGRGISTADIYRADADSALAVMGARTAEAPMTRPDIEEFERIAAIHKADGYETRPSISVGQLDSLIAYVKELEAENSSLRASASQAEERVKALEGELAQTRALCDVALDSLERAVSAEREACAAIVDSTSSSLRSAATLHMEINNEAASERCRVRSLFARELAAAIRARSAGGR